jgi:predicted ribosomally synthesized peptide with SipW-like signal peptide
MKKTMMGLAGGAFALTLIGGGTYAAWSDFDTVTGNETEAGHLVLNTNSTGTINNVGSSSIAPGEFRTIDFFVTSADLDGVPSADLSMQLNNLADDENGCASNSEAALDDCSSPVGEFSSQGYVRVRFTDPAAIGDITFAGNNCAAPSGYTHSVGYSPANNNDSTVYPRLSAFANTNHALGTLTGGQGLCVRIDIGLDPGATDVVQSDSSTFDLTYRLDQHL